MSTCTHGNDTRQLKCPHCAQNDETKRRYAEAWQGDIDALRAELERTRQERDEARRERDRLRKALELIAAPKRADGTYNRCREACEQIARAALGQKDSDG
jgi:chromosome segregation ATPase